MADNLIGGGGGDLQLQNILIDAQNRAAQNGPDVNDDAERDAIRKAAEKRLAIKQSGLQQQATGERFDKKGASSALYDAAFSGKMGADVQRWAQDSKLQKTLTGAQRRLFLESLQASSGVEASGVSAAPQAAAAAAAINRLASAPSFYQATSNTRSMGEVHQAVAQNPRLAEPFRQNVLDSRFMQSSKADPATKTDFLRFGLQNLQKGNLQSVKVAGDMLGSLAGTQTPDIGQRAAMKMALRDPSNELGMSNVDGFVQQPAVRGMPGLARGRATEVLARADGATDVRSGLEAVAQDTAFSGLGREDKARVFSTIGQGRASDLRAITDKVLQTLQSPDFPARQGQVSNLLRQLGGQVKQTGADGISPRTLIRAAKKSGVPVAPTLVSTAAIDPDEEGAEEAMTQARAKNRASVMKYYNQMAGSYDDVGEKLEGAKYFEDVSMLSGLRPTEELDTSALSVSDEFRGALDEQLGTLKEGLTGGQQQAKKSQYNDALKTLVQTMGKQLGRPLSTDEATLVLVQSKQAQSELRFNDLTKQKNQRMRELRGQRMPPSKRQAQAAERRAVGEQPQYFSPDAARSARGAFGPAAAQQFGGRGALPQAPTLGRQVQNQAGVDQSRRPVLPQGPAGLPHTGAAARGDPQLAGRAAPVGAPGAFGTANSVDDEVAQLMQSLDPSLTPAAKMGQVRQIMAERLQHQIDVTKKTMDQLLAAPQSIEQASQEQQLGQPTTARGGNKVAEHASPPTAPPAYGLDDLTPPPYSAADAAPPPYSSDDAALTGGRLQASGLVGTGPKSLAAVEAISHERPRGAAAKLAAMVADASAAAQAAPARAAGDMAKAALSELGAQLEAPMAAANAAASKFLEISAPTRPLTVQGKTDGWGIPRTFERDLGAAGAPTVRPARAEAAANSSDAVGAQSGAVAPEQYTGRTMVKSSTPVRDVATLQQTPWKQLSSAESALLKNLGWSQKTWDTQTSPKAQWPRSMGTPYRQLSAKHREAVKRLGLSERDWDDAVNAGMGGGGPRR